jgi:hypothetical protein
MAKAKRKGPPGHKRGLSSTEMETIRAWSEEGRTVTEIAEEVGRAEDVVRRAIIRIGGSPVHEDPTLPPDMRMKASGPVPNSKNRHIAELRRSPVFQLLCKQMTPAERYFFEEMFADIVEQFGDDITPTERESVRKVCLMSVHLHRNGEDQLTVRREADRIHVNVKLLETSHPDTDDMPRMVETQKRVDELYRSAGRSEQRLTTLSSTYADLSREHQRLFESLKSTRDQRLDRATRVTSVQDLLKQLMEEKRLQAEGRRAELMRRSMTHEAARLAEPHEYADGTYDQPLLTPETVMLTAKRSPLPSPKRLAVTNEYEQIPQGGDEHAPDEDEDGPVPDGGGEAPAS